MNNLKLFRTLYLTLSSQSVVNFCNTPDSSRKNPIDRFIGKASLGKLNKMRSINEIFDYCDITEDIIYLINQTEDWDLIHR